MSAAANIIAFRKLLRERFPEAHVAQGPARERAAGSGLACVDSLGLLPGCVTEVVAVAGSTGAGLLIHSLLEGAGEAIRLPVALVDGGDGFDPGFVSPAARERLLWVRCREPMIAARATDLLLRDGNLVRVLVDLQLCHAQAVRSLPLQVWHRLRLLAEKSGVALCVFTPCQAVACARTRVLMERPFALGALDMPRQELLAGLPVRTTRRVA